MKYKDFFTISLIAVVMFLTACNSAQKAHVIWKFKTAFPGTAAPVISGDKVYFGSDKLYCLNKLTGKLIWAFDPFGVIKAPPVVLDGYLYFACGGLYCLDALTGEMKWEFWTDNWAHKTPIVSGRVVYIVINKTAYGINKQDGTKFWEAEVCYSDYSPVVTD